MRFQLEGPSLEAIHVRAVAEYGQHARIVSAEKIATGGIGKFLAREHFEAIIEVPDSHAPAGHIIDPEMVKNADITRPTPNDDTRRSAPVGGLQGLLERADAAEQQLTSGVQESARESKAEPVARDFGRLLDGQVFALEAPTGARAVENVSIQGGPREDKPEAYVAHAEREHQIIPSTLSAPGDLVVVIGLWGDAGIAAQELDDGVAIRRNAGELAQKFDTNALSRKPLVDRRGILKARAAAVADGVWSLVSVAINPQLPLLPQLDLLELLEADQLWVAVDAGRKVEDTAAWVNYVAARNRLYAVVSLHADETLSPESVWELGFPVLEARGPVG